MKSRILSLLLLLFSLLRRSSAAAPASPRAVSAYEILKSYNLPPGLLPKGATSYELDAATGDFTVYFDGTCSFSLEGSYSLRYKPTVSGRISQNRLRNLKGVSVKVLLLWLNIVEVERDGDDLDFSVGIASASFDIDSFEEIPQCGCGFDCVNGGDPNPDPNPIRLRGVV